MNMFLVSAVLIHTYTCPAVIQYCKHHQNEYVIQPDNIEYIISVL